MACRDASTRRRGSPNKRHKSMRPGPSLTSGRKSLESLERRANAQHQQAVEVPGALNAGNWPRRGPRWSVGRRTRNATSTSWRAGGRSSRHQQTEAAAIAQTFAEQRAECERRQGRRRRRAGPTRPAERPGSRIAQRTGPSGALSWSRRATKLRPNTPSSIGRCAELDRNHAEAATTAQSEREQRLTEQAQRLHEEQAALAAEREELSQSRKTEETRLAERSCARTDGTRVGAASRAAHGRARGASSPGRGNGRSSPCSAGSDRGTSRRFGRTAGRARRGAPRHSSAERAIAGICRAIRAAVGRAGRTAVGACPRARCPARGCAACDERPSADAGTGVATSLSAELIEELVETRCDQQLAAELSEVNEAGTVETEVTEAEVEESDEQPVSPRRARTGGSAEPADEEESIEQYFANLLQRTRSGSPVSTPAPQPKRGKRKSDSLPVREQPAPAAVPAKPSEPDSLPVVDIAEVPTEMTRRAPVETTDMAAPARIGQHARSHRAGPPRSQATDQHGACDVDRGARIVTSDRAGAFRRGSPPYGAAHAGDGRLRGYRVLDVQRWHRLAAALCGAPAQQSSLRENIERAERTKTT